MARQELRVDGTLDIECADWDVFCVGATYDGHRARVYYDGDQMIDDLRRAGGTYYAHAGGVYDLLYVLDRALARGIACQVDRSQHRVTRVVMGRLTLRDSYSLWPAPLGDLCGAIGEPEPSLPWSCVCCTRCGSGRRCTCDRGCGGFCQIRTRAAQGDPDLEDYVKADARVLFLALRHLREVAADHGVALRGTLGQTAWVSAQDELGVPDSEIPYALWRHIRAADKGGRAVVVRPRVGSVVPDHLTYFDARSRRERASVDWPVVPGSVVGAHHDICSAYPAQLARAHLPVGPCREVGGRDASLALDNRAPGLYTVSVAVPDDTFLPPLPWHKSTGICYPTGEFSGTWVLPEILAALERGVELRAVHTALVWEATAPIFAPLVERWYEVRRSLGRRTPMGSWVAGLARALTGTLAMGPDRDRVSMFPDPDNIKVCPRTGPCRGRRCTRRCGSYEQIDLHGYVWSIPYHQMPKSAYPEWSAYLRAMTRVQWLSQAELMGDGGRLVCLGNTDSLWHLSRQSPEPLGDGIGQWEYQHAFTDLEVRSPTIYAYRDPASDPPGSLQIRGIPGISEADWRRGSGVLDRGIVPFTTAAGSDRGLFHRRSRRWSLPGDERTLYGDRRLAGDGLTYPLDAEEVRHLGRLLEERRRVRDRADETGQVDAR